MSTSSADARIAFVLSVGSEAGARAQRGLERRGFTVGYLGEQPGTAPAMRVDFKSQASAFEGMARAVAAVGAPQLIVLSFTPSRSVAPRATDSIPADEWRRGTHESSLQFLHALQACHTTLKASGGTVVVLAPVLGLVGATQMLSYSTVLEAQRALVKSAARQWGGLGIRIHWIGVGTPGNYPELQDVPVPVGPELGPPPPALGRTADIDRDLGAVFAFLADAGAKALTGLSLVADGGEWMVP